MKKPLFQISAPGRICLFGEHSDYLGLPVITMAMNLSLTISVFPRKDRLFKIKMPDLKQTDEFNPSRLLTYSNPRDYLRGAVNVLKRKGYRFSKGYDFMIRSSIPINAGASSSSALVIAWLRTLLELNQTETAFNPLEIARLGFETEVLEFKEAGGRMDHFAISMGGLIYHENRNPNSKNYPIEIIFFQGPLRGLVLGDSLEPKKDTVGHLKQNKAAVLEGLKQFQSKIRDFQIQKTALSEIRKKINIRGAALQKAFATLKNRDICQNAKREFIFQNKGWEKRLGALLNAHHLILKNELEISTPKIESMIRVAKKAGALGCKINGSGLGGTMIAFAPGREKEVEKALRRIGAKAYILKQSQGVQKR